MPTDAKAAEVAGSQASPAERPYAPSWLDAFVGWIDRLPGPAWLALGVIAGLFVAYVALEATLSSRGLFGQQPAYFAYAFIHFYPLAAYYYLSRGAMTAWDDFRPATSLTDSRAERMRLELSTSPARPAALLAVLTAISYAGLLLALPDGFDLVGHQPAFVGLRVLSEVFWLAPVIASVTYLFFRQLRIVSRLHDSVVHVNLLEPAPLHAMARLTARSAFVMLVFQVVSFAPLPNQSDSVRLALILIAAPFLVLTAATFFLPLRGMHGLLEKERARLLSGVHTRIAATMATLHEVVDSETVGSPEADLSRLAQVRIDALNKALASLLQERDFVRRLSTWPWDTGTLRAVLSAVALPIVLFLLTRLLERFGF